MTQSQAFDNFNCEPGSCCCKTVACLQAKWETAIFCNWEPQNISSQDNLSILLRRSKTVLKQHCNSEPGFNTTSSAKVCSAKFEHRYFLYTVTPDYHFLRWYYSLGYYHHAFYFYQLLVLFSFTIAFFTSCYQKNIACEIQLCNIRSCLPFVFYII